MINISKKLLRVVGQTNAKYKMFEEGDKILLGLSGGKDSMSLAHILKHFQSVSPLKWEFEAVTISYGIGEDLSEISKHFKEHEIPYRIIETKIFEFGKEKIRANTTFCSFCSRMRRGYLYTYALENGFNKIAIAHHLDDAAESFFMNFTYNGALRTLAPKYTAKNGLVIIRPLILARERQLSACAAQNELPVMNEEDSCPAKQYGGKEPIARAATKELLAQYEKAHPKFFISLESAFNNIHDDTFFTPKF
ncbi:MULTISPECIES: tRNA 2-thiocytidine biosynthesis TtcA family protein [unclassified Campylobacter]|uniref:tRNA 2-thiocytidine biosynthesis TtcA family protein n=1 Tax=unclassified Campylobacter TaxID=2593542 RepID=UPI0022E9D5F7|nr:MULTISPECIES: ATP-binding protein [unclassified Campylobacter]MDA3043172.1 tRNA 2-thiocytidine biosynthesis protein TtcA [Campylobacter sp. JMF_09 ED2]MDA3044790.1 tRNA 2-thiocytidine biosynthesis protein TtcA [Campylobacter sp. JMF_07 ED4]MDA3063826.1 tRNA 2-thiocytidine biosynthesis protein TtcA [Campylobacter sp. JMF_11 EL3]MDA3072125.1 tRNA 2-thiocytidine biosynthesis protein TtcA [Campylobacter sp. VBCF_03 NA9]MDA3075144.1 tRNA 2-thiocytidine biosynthesis protein TtcA [Campylobacter sp